MLHLPSTNLKQLPGRVRVVLVFALIVPIPFFLFVLSKLPDSTEAGEILGWWLGLVAASAILGYILTAFVSLMLWIQNGFDELTWTRATRMLSRLSIFVIILAAGVLFAAYARFDVVAVVSRSGTYYEYLVWDRWSGDTYLETGSTELDNRGRVFR